MRRGWGGPGAALAAACLVTACSSGGDPGPMFPSGVSGPGLPGGSTGADPTPVEESTGGSGAAEGSTGPWPSPSTGPGGPTTDDGADASTGEDVVLPEDGRVAEGVVALYRFDEGAGAQIQDSSLLAPALPLAIPGGAPIVWIPGGGIQFQGASSAATSGGALKVAQACKASNELTVEAWVTPAEATSDVFGPGRILTFSTDASNRNFTLGQIGNAYSLRVRTSNTNANGIFQDADPITGGVASTALTHLVVTYTAAGLALYQGGALQASTAVGGGFEGWTDSYTLRVGDEATGDRAWLGGLHLAAVYCRALTSVEVAQNFAAGF